MTVTDRDHTLQALQWRSFCYLSSDGRTSVYQVEGCRLKIVILLTKNCFHLHEHAFCNMKLCTLQSIEASVKWFPEQNNLQMLVTLRRKCWRRRGEKGGEGEVEEKG